MLGINFICRESKSDKRGMSPVECSIRYGGSCTYMVLPRKEFPDVFRRLMSQKKDNDLKSFCLDAHRRVQSAVGDLLREGIPFDARVIKEYLNGKYSVRYTVSMLCSEYLGLLKKRVDGGSLSLGNYFKYERVLSRLLSVVGKDADVSEITNAVMLSVLTGLRGEYQAATVSNYWTKLKSVVKYAIDNGKLSHNPCSGIKVGKGEKRIEIMSDCEYLRLRDKVLSVERLSKVRDLFVFACNSGLSYCDVVSLSKSDFSVVDGRVVVNKERRKTGVRFYSVILPDGVKILERYDWDLSVLFLSNQKVNSYAKELQDICGIGLSLHFHLCRHFYITKLIRLGVPVSVVQLCAGHSNIRMTQKYTHLGCEDVVRSVSKCI